MIQAGIAREPDHDLAAILAQKHGCRSVIAFLPDIEDFWFDELVFVPLKYRQNEAIQRQCAGYCVRGLQACGWAWRS